MSANIRTIPRCRTGKVQSGAKADRR